MPPPQTPSVTRTTYPPWVVTFADLMSLLMTFFVLLFSTSTLDKDKYRSVADAMEKAFGPGASQAVIEIANRQDILRDPQSDPGDIADTATRLRQALGNEIREGMLEVESRKGEIVVRFPERIAFQSGSEVLTPTFDPVVEKMVAILAKTQGKIVVVGHSDDVPIVTERFRSNWELSAARAVSVIHALRARASLDAQRLVAQGVADTQPLVANDSPQHRAQNRRVEILILETKNDSKSAAVLSTSP
ncbi:MAG: OmpA family protein [Gammaproteobacteria bacterium]|nr:OmpA family protein [Gammaproteobacteria bacterium]